MAVEFTPRGGCNTCNFVLVGKQLAARIRFPFFPLNYAFSARFPLFHLQRQLQIVRNFVYFAASLS